MSFGARDVGHAGQLDEDFVALRLPGDARLGDAERVDAAIDRLQRLTTVCSRRSRSTFGFIVKS